MKATRRLKYALLAPAFLVATIALQFVNVQFASAAALTWTGNGSNDNFSTVENWSTGTAPQDGDTLIFSVEGLNAAVQPYNDIGGLTLNGITISGNAAGYSGAYRFSGNHIYLNGNITNTAAYDGYPTDVQFNQTIVLNANATFTGPISVGILNLGAYTLTDGTTVQACGTSLGVLQGSGNIVASGSQSRLVFMSASPAYTGAITVSNGSAAFDNPAVLGDANRVTVSGAGSITLNTEQNTTWTTPFTFGGSGQVNVYHGGYGCGGSAPAEKFTSTLTGGVTLTSNFRYSGADHLTINEPYTANGFTLAVAGGSTGTLTLPSGSSEAEEETITFDGDQPTQFESIGFRQIGVLNGTRSGISIAEGGTLKGTGTAASIYNNSGVIAPGNSPGTITALESLSNSGVIQIEIKDKSTHDQLKVGENSTDAYQGVNLNPGSILSLTLLEGWNIQQGDKFTIIDNLSNNAVVGTFDGLAEGAQITIEGVTFSISYVGGNGNDVVLTALSTGTDVTAPNTGAFQVALANPAVVAGLGIVTAGVLAALALRRRANQ